MRVYILKNSSNFHQLLPKVSEEWAAVQLLIGSDLSLKDAEYQLTDLTGESFNGQSILFSLRRCPLIQ
jgi:hypothetical protein